MAQMLQDGVSIAHSRSKGQRLVGSEHTYLEAHGRDLSGLMTRLIVSLTGLIELSPFISRVTTGGRKQKGLGFGMFSGAGGRPIPVTQTCSNLVAGRGRKNSGIGGFPQQTHLQIDNCTAQSH